MTGEDLDEPLEIGIMLLARELLVPDVFARCVESPRRSVWNDERLETPLVKLAEEVRRGLGDLAAVVWQLG